MSEVGLKPVSPLGGFVFEAGGVSVVEVVDLAVVAVSVPLGGMDAMAEALRSSGGLTWPETGRWIGEQMRLLGLSSDQAFLVFRHDRPDAGRVVADMLGDAAYLFDQSDAWAILRIAGEHSRDALERICILDLDDDVFPVGAVSRTQMEHLSVILLREAADSWLLMSPRSSAESFLDAVMTSVRNIVPGA